MNFLSVPETPRELEERVPDRSSFQTFTTSHLPYARDVNAKNYPVSPLVFHPSKETLRAQRRSSWTRRGGQVEPLFLTMTQSWEKDQGKKSRSYAKMQRGQKKNILALCCAKTMKSLCHIQSILKTLVKSEPFEVFTFLAICLNCIELVFQTFAEVEIWGEWYFAVLDSVFLCIYFMEAVLKILVFGLGYFHKWNNLDFAIVIMALLDFVLKQIYFSSAKRLSESKTIFRVLKIFKSFRSLRAIRVLWKLKFLTSLKAVAETLARSASSITAILVLMFTCLFFFSVILRTLFHETDPKRFENLFTTIFTLFTMLTLDDWSIIYLDSLREGAGYIIPILMVYIVIQYLIFLNLVIAVLVDNFQIVLRNKQERAKEQKEALRHEKLLDESLTILEKEVEEQKSDVIFLKTIQKRYGHFTPAQKDTMIHYLQLMAAVEHHQQMFRSQAAIIDEIIDTAFEVEEDE